MGVLVKLPRTVSGAELADAIEMAGREIGCEVKSEKEMYYKLGSIQSQELKRSVAMIYVAETKTIRKGILWIRKAVVPARRIIISAMEVSAENQADQIELGLRKYDYYHCLGLLGYEVATSDAGFNEIRPFFEKFLAALYRILEQGPQSLPPSPPPPPPPPNAPWYKPDKITAMG